MKRTYCILAACAALGLASCGGKEDKAANDTVEELPIVTVDVAYAKDVPQTKTYTANVEAENLNNISPSTPNRIKTIRVDVGDHVRRGQELVVMDMANADQLRINRDQIEREYNRALQLLQIGAGTQQAVDQLKAQFDAANTQYNNMLENTVLRSPIDGVVTARNYDPGDMYTQLPILSVGQLSPEVKVMVNANETDMANIQRGKDVTVTLDAFPGREFTGRITRVYPTVDAATRTVPVEIRVANPKEEIKPGMFANVVFQHSTQHNVVVPDRAVVKQQGSGNKYVYVLNNGHVEYRHVQLGQRLDDSYELLGGIADGDTVVITGQSRLADGVAVEVRR